MGFDFSLFDILSRFLKVDVAEELKDFIDILTELKIANACASTYLLFGSVESYLAAVGKMPNNYVLTKVSFYSEDASNIYESKFEEIEEIIDVDGVVGAKLFEGGKFDMNLIRAEYNMICEAKEKGAEVVVGVKYRRDDGNSMGGISSSVYLEGVALVPRGE